MKMNSVMFCTLMRSAIFKRKVRHKVLMFSTIDSTTSYYIDPRNILYNAGTTDQRQNGTTTTTTTNVSSNFFTTTGINDDTQNQQQYLMTMTIQWLQDSRDNNNSNNHSTRHRSAMAKNLIERWIQYFDDHNGITVNNDNRYSNNKDNINTNENTIRFVLIIIKRWLYQRHPSFDHDSKELMHYMYRILFIIQQDTKQQLKSSSLSMNKNTHKNYTCSNAYQLLQTFYTYSITMNETKLLPKPKAYSMVLEIFSNVLLLKKKLTKKAISNHNNTNHQATGNDNCIDSEEDFTAMADQLMEQLNTTVHALQPHQQMSQILSDIIVAQNSYLQLLARYATIQQLQQITEKAEHYLFHNMVQPNIKSYTAVIQGWVNINSPKRAIALFDHMIENGILPDQICYNVCLHALGNAGYARQAHEMLCKMTQIARENHDKSLLPDAYSFLAVIKAYTKCNEPNKAVEVLEQMIRQESQMQNGNSGTNSNNHITTIYTTILDVLARQPNSGPNVEFMLQHMEQLYQQTGIGQPCREAYTIAIRAWGQMTTTNIIAPDRATDIFRRMQNKSIEQQSCDRYHQYDLSPCIISYTTLIHAWAQSYRIDAPKHALQILRHIEHQQKLYQQGDNIDAVGVSPDTITYNVVLSAFARHGLANDAQQLLNEMKARMLTDHDGIYVTMYPNVISYATVIHAYKNSRRHDADIRANVLLLELEHLYDTTGNTSLKPTPDIYSAAILAQHTNIEVAEKIFWRMVDRHEQKQHHSSTVDCNTLYAPNTCVCNALLRLWSKSEDPVAPQRAEMILHWMERYMEQRNDDDGTISSIVPNYDSYRFVLQAWYKSKRRNAYQYIHKIQSKIRLKYPSIQE
jgi:pentatricopeptide repeat protein